MNRLIYALMIFTGTIWAQNPQNQTPALPAVELHNTACVVRLLSPLSTRTAREGDLFTAMMEEPKELQGAIVEGRITKLKKPEKGTNKGKAELQFQFETLTWQNQTKKIQAELTDVKNSEGKSKVDEEGHVIGVSSHKKRVLGALLGAAAGAAMGAAAGGSKGAAIGAAAGGAAGFFLALKMTTSASDIEFKPGATFNLNVTSTPQS
jgi:hypothetical protein